MGGRSTRATVGKPPSIACLAGLLALGPAACDADEGARARGGAADAGHGGSGASAASGGGGDGAGSGAGGSTASGGSGGAGAATGGGGASAGGGALGGGGTGGATSTSSGGASGSGGAGGCGDGVRDPLAEECDEGPGNASVSCTAACQVTDFFASPMTDAVLEAGRHPAGAGADGFAVAFVDRAASPGAPMLAVFAPDGAPLGPAVPLGPALGPAEPSSPVVAALPGGVFAAAWTDLGEDGDLRGVAVQRIDPAAAVQTPPVHANEVTDFNQFDADMIWTGSELVVAWADDSSPSGFGDLYVRTFDADVAPISAATLLAGTSEIEARVALAPHAGTWAAAWRTADGGLEYVTVRAGAVTWEAGPLVPAPVDDRPALVELDAGHLLVVYSEGDPVDPAISVISAAVLDAAAPGSATGSALAPGPTSQSQPTAVRAGGRWFAAWRAESAGADPLAEELLLLELFWDAATQTLTAAPATLPLPRWPGDQLGDQRRPGLAFAPLGPEGALLGCWEDWAASQSAPNVRVELMPIPILRL